MGDAVDWDEVTRAFDGELAAWTRYADEVRQWADDVRSRIEAGRALTDAQARLAEGVDRAQHLQQLLWYAEAVGRIPAVLRTALTAAKVSVALTTVLNPGPSARGMDYQAHALSWTLYHDETGLRTPSEVSDPERIRCIRRAFLHDAEHVEDLRDNPAALQAAIDFTNGREAAYVAHLQANGNPWAG